MDDQRQRFTPHDEEWKPNLDLNPRLDCGAGILGSRFNHSAPVAPLSTHNNISYLLKYDEQKQRFTPLFHELNSTI